MLTKGKDLAKRIYKIQLEFIKTRIINQEKSIF